MKKVKKVKKSQDKFKNIPQFFNMCIGKKCSANLPEGSLAEQIIKERDGWIIIITH